MTIDRIDIMENEIFISIYPKINEMEIEGKIFPIDDETIENLLRILRTWDNEYVNNTYFDGNRYEVRIHEGENTEVFKGTRSGPENYNEFTRLIRSIYGRR